MDEHEIVSKVQFHLRWVQEFSAVQVSCWCGALVDVESLAFYLLEAEMEDAAWKWKILELGTP
jgi:hypothetical protein